MLVKNTSIAHMTNETKLAGSKTEIAIKKLEALMDSTIEIPKMFSFVKPERLHEILKELEAAVKEDMEYSQSINLREQEILENAQRQADELIRRTQRELESQDSVQRAQTYAKQLAAEAEKRARELLEEGQLVQQQLIVNGHKYVDKLLLEIEEEFRTKSDKIAVNRAELMNSLNEKKKKMTT